MHPAKKPRAKSPEQTATIKKPGEKYKRTRAVVNITPADGERYDIINSIRAGKGKEKMVIDTLKKIGRRRQKSEFRTANSEYKVFKFVVPTRSKDKLLRFKA